jgi:hypothetical protein
MTDIAFVSITRALRDLLAGPTAVADVVMRGRLKPLAANLNTAVVVRFDRSSGDQATMANGPTDWTSSIALDCYARATGDVDPEDVAGPVLQAVYQRLAVADMAALGVTQLVASTEVQASFAEADPNLACMTLFISVQHMTDFNSLTPRT